MNDFVDEYPRRSWDVWSSLVFKKTNEEWGGFSNMCAGYPIIVNGVKWLTSEALYQALRFPEHPEIQEIIRSERSPMAAKMKSKPFRSQNSRADWDEIRVQAMWWCLAAKLMANEQTFGDLLLRSKSSDIVEHSHKDKFWGAVKVTDDYLQGQNVLGVLTMKLRAVYKREGISAVQALKPPSGTIILGSTAYKVESTEPEDPLTLF